MGIILSFLGGSIARYLLIGVASIAVLGFVRHEIRAPLMREIFALHAANAAYELIAENDRKRAELAEADLAAREAATETVIHDANINPSTCRLSASDLGKLRDLAGTAKRRN